MHEGNGCNHQHKEGDHCRHGSHSHDADAPSHEHAHEHHGDCAYIGVKALAVFIVSMFAFIFLSDMVIHGYLLRDMYLASASLWRSDQEMQQHMIWLIAGQALTAAIATFIFAKGYEGRGVAEGLRFGVLIAGLAVASFFVQFAVTPLPQEILVAWCGLTLVQFLIAGVLLSFLFRAALKRK